MGDLPKTMVEFLKTFVPSSDYRIGFGTKEGQICRERQARTLNNYYLRNEVGHVHISPLCPHRVFFTDNLPLLFSSAYDRFSRLRILCNDLTSTHV